MDRNGRSAIERLTRTFTGRLHDLADAYTTSIASLTRAEEDKLERLPEPLQDSPTGLAVQEAVDLLVGLQDLVQPLLDAVDEIADLAGVDSARLTAVTDGKDDGAALFALVPAGMMERLARAAARTGVSEDNLVCLALEMYL